MRARFRRRKFKNKSNKNILENKVVIVLIIFTTFFSLFSFINRRLTKNLGVVMKESVDKLNNTIFTNYIDRHLLNEVNLNNIIELVRNDKDEIIGVDYNLENAYKVLALATERVKEGINKMEEGDLEKVDPFFKVGKRYNNSFVVMVPLGVVSNSVLFNSIGPRIPIKITLMENLLNSISTKVENYGINNVLVEIYMNFDVTTSILTPVEKESIKNNYSILIASLIVNGEVPGYLGLVEENSPLSTG